MNESTRLRNVAVFLVLAVVFFLPTLFLSPDHSLDLWGFLMIVFGIVGLSMVAGEAWTSFWSGSRDRAALALYGLSALFLSVIAMRAYGIVTRNIAGTEWISDSYAYSGFVFIQFIGLYLFSQASTPPSVSPHRTRYGQLITGILIGALIASSRALEPILLFLSKLWNRMF